MVDKTAKLAKELIDNLALAFGGLSQVPDRVVGMAIYTNTNGGAWRHAVDSEACEIVDASVKIIASCYELDNAAEEQCRRDVMAGFNEAKAVALAFCPID